MLPLDGIRVLETTQVYAGPHAAMLLSLLGAEVLKVEPPSGDQLRPRSVNFRHENLGKGSVVLDLKVEEGQERFKELIKDADVLLDNFLPGKLDQLGLSHNELREINSDLVQVTINGYGTKGPMKNAPAFDGIVQALVGMYDGYLPPSQDADFSLPAQQLVTVDAGTALVATNAALMGIIQQQRTQKGCHIQTSLLESGIELLLFSFLAERNAGPLAAGEMRAPSGPGPANTGIFALACADDQRLILMIGLSDAIWKKLVSAPGFEVLATDSRFATYGDRVENYWLLAGEIQQRFVAEPAAHWVKTLDGIPLSPYLSMAQAAFHEQIEALDLFQFDEEKQEWLWRGPWTIDGVRPTRKEGEPELGNAQGWNDLSGGS